MRIGVNSGSLPKHLHELERRNSVEALVQAGVEFVELMESLDFENFKISIKSTNVPNTIASNRLLAEKVPYPIHLGITEAGTKWSGSLKSSVGLGTLLADVGDTIRISLSPSTRRRRSGRLGVPQGPAPAERTIRSPADHGRPFG
jgi:(E)-4-hydroxy-3-methylbut-2-enyl-diphosphate synthase